jgi:MinD-like ATPase involved in chromosome partitioning or flagellar assembly
LETRPPEVESSLGRVITFWSAHGSAGKSTLASNLACELASSGQRVFLLDADTYAPSLAQLFGLFDHPAGLGAACRILGQDRFDIEQLNRLSLQLAIGRKTLTIMTGIGTHQRWAEVTAERLCALIEVAKQNFDFILVDVASPLENGLTLAYSNLARNAATRAALELADSVVAISAADPISIKRFLDALGEVPVRSEMITVVNRLRTAALGSGPKQQITETLSRLANLEVDAFIPEDQPSFDKAVLTNLPIALSKRNSPARAAIALFARQYLLKERNNLDGRVRG